VFSRSWPLALLVLVALAFGAGCAPASTPVKSALTQAGPAPLAVADALEALIAVKADTPGDRRYAYDRLSAAAPKTAEDALARAIVAGRLAQVSGLAALGLVGEVERYAAESARLDPALRSGAAERLLGSLYVMAPASLLEHGDSEKGLELLEGVVRRFPEHAGNHLRLAEGYIALGDPEPARPHLCFCRGHRATLRTDEQRLLDELGAQAKLEKCP
jgi:hypothetical protein